MACKKISLDALLAKNSWTPTEAAAWANIPLRAMYDLLARGIIPVLPMVNRQNQKFPKAKNGKRGRACYRFIIPALAFRRTWETMRGRAVGSDDQTAA
jgi:hypothetical protein